LRPLAWDKVKNIREAGHWLAKRIELIELKHRQRERDTSSTVKT